MTVHILNFSDWVDTEKLSAFDQDDVIIIYLGDWVFDAQEHMVLEVMHRHEATGRNIYWLIDDMYRPFLAEVPCHYNIRYVQGLMLAMYFRLFEQRLCALNQEWNSGADKFLLLTGKPHAPNRMRLVWRFWQAGLLNRSLHSLLLNDDLKTHCRRYFPELNDSEYSEFVAEAQNHADGAFRFDTVGHGTQCHFGGVPFDLALFRDTSFRVISETWRGNIVWTTEKTWLTMLNRQPFIMASVPGTLAKLRDMGFRTFQDYLPLRDYDCIQDTDTRWQAVITNTGYWLEHIRDHHSDIAADLEHNYHRVIELALVSRDIITDMLHEAGGPHRDPYRVLPMYDVLQDTWVPFYYGIKDPTWPDCYNEKDFHLLPQHIQRECIEVFNYEPRT
jgi:hypothetical protein